MKDIKLNSKKIICFAMTLLVLAIVFGVVKAEPVKAATPNYQIRIMSSPPSSFETIPSSDITPKVGTGFYLLVYDKNRTTTMKSGELYAGNQKLFDSGNTSAINWFWNNEKYGVTKAGTLNFKAIITKRDGSKVTITKDVNITILTKYTVSYHANGGSGAPSSQTKEYGKTLTLSSTKPTRTGYDFQGWATSSTASSASYKAGGSYTDNKAVTLYAVWKLKEYKVTYNANGGSGAPSAQTKYHGKTLTLSSTKPTRTGYTFQGWATSSTASGAAYNAGGSYTDNKAVTLYAVWKLKEYKVAYHANGGSGVPLSQTKYHGKALTLSDTEPTRTGYIFQGWATSSTATSKEYSAGGSYTGNKAITLYAVWKLEPRRYTIAYNANGGKNPPFSQAKTHGETLILSNMIPTRTGYEFLGWAEDQEASSVAYNAGDKYEKDSDATLYAVWKLIEKQYEKSAADMRGPQEKTDGTIEWDCIWFGNYKQSADGNGGFKKKPIKWRVLSVSGNDAFLLADRSLDCKKYHETDESVTWETCTLRGWLNNEFINEAFSPDEQQAIQATHVVNEDNSEYGTEGGNDTTDRIYLLSIEEAGKPAHGFSSDYDADDAERCSKNTDYASEQGAHASEDSDYKGNGWWWLRSSGSPSNCAAYVNDDGYVYRNGDNVSYDCDAVRPVLHLNLESSCWSYAGMVSGKETVEEKVPTYKISYDANGGIGAPSPQTKLYDETLKLSGMIPTKAGFDFLGWSESKTAGIATYKAGDGYANNGSMTLYAVWKERSKADASQDQNAGTAKDEGKQRKEQTISASSKKLTYKGKTVALKAKTSGDGTLSYESSNKKVVTVSASGTVTPKECGSAKITIKAAETEEYKAQEKTITVKVTLKKPVLKLKGMGRSSVKASWKKVPGASGYKVYRYDTKKKKYVCVITKKTKQRSATARIAKKGKVYQFKMRAYRKVGKKTLYGPYSKIVKIRW